MVLFVLPKSQGPASKLVKYRLLQVARHHISFNDRSPPWVFGTWLQKRHSLEGIVVRFGVELSPERLVVLKSANRVRVEVLHPQTYAIHQRRQATAGKRDRTQIPDVAAANVAQDLEKELMQSALAWEQLLTSSDRVRRAAVIALSHENFSNGRVRQGERDGRLKEQVVDGG